MNVYSVQYTYVYSVQYQRQREYHKDTCKTAGELLFHDPFRISVKITDFVSADPRLLSYFLNSHFFLLSSTFCSTVSDTTFIIISLLQTIYTYIQLYCSMTAALEGGEWPAVRTGRILPPGKARYPFYRRLGGPQGRSGRVENLVPTVANCILYYYYTKLTFWRRNNFFNFSTPCI